MMKELTMKLYNEKQEITFIADPKVIAIPIQENGDTFIDLKDQNQLTYRPSPEVPNNTDYTKIRKIVYEKILKAQALLPKGIRFCLYEAYRSLGLQKTLFDNRYHLITNHYPNGTHEQIFEETTRLISPVINLDGTKNIPPHSTGGAFDIYLIDEQKQPLDIGIHPKDCREKNDGSLSQTNSTIISPEAKANRAIMNKALEGVGFVNYPTEYWHWSYGDRYWAYQLGRTHAIYGNLKTSGN
jgi:D-alanyl-D-alanine dipeptidase